MKHFTPTLEAKDTSLNVRGFVKENLDVFWDIFKPLAPYFVILTLIDSFVPALFFEPDPETGEYAEFGLGGLLSSYFMACLVISWHRVVIHGANNYVPMNPFKPQRDEWAFIITGILIGLTVFVVSLVTMLALGALMGAAVVIVILPLIILAAYIGFKFSFYFPAKATGQHVSLMQSFSLTDGYLWKIFAVGIRAPIKLILMMFLYLIAGVIVIFGLVSILGDGTSELVFSLLGFAFSMPIVLYFQPLLTVIGVTVLSNYYQHAMQYRDSTLERRRSEHDES